MHSYHLRKGIGRDPFYYVVVCLLTEGRKNTKPLLSKNEMREMATVSSRVATAEKDDIDRAFDEIVCLDETYTNIGIHHGRIEAIQRREQEGYVERKRTLS